MESVQKKQSLVERDRQNVWHHISPYSEKIRLWSWKRGRAPGLQIIKENSI